MKSQKNIFVNRELSWLEFNERVLAEADDPSVPLIERIRFLGIFSNNLDEFFRVRYATVKRIAVSSNSGKRIFKDRTAKELLNEITLKSKTLQDKSFKVLDSIIKLLENENIFFIDENSVESNHKTFISEYFFEYISPSIDVIILNSKKKFPKFKDNLSFLIVRMELENNEIQNAIIRIPKTLNRFVQLPCKKFKNQIIIIDDIIRLHLKDILKFLIQSRLKPIWLRLVVMLN
jgi:polyphosphate kinase